MTGHSFVALVRANHIAQPSHPARFTAAAWTATFQAFPQQTEVDSRLHAAGLWFAQKFAALAQATGDVRFPTTDLLSLVRYHIGAANRDVQILNEMHIDSESLLVSEQYIQARFEPVPGSPAHPEDVLEETIDRLKFCLDSLRLYDRPASPGQTPEAEVGRLRYHLGLGTLFRWYVDLWNRCLWNDWRIETTGPADAVVPPPDFEVIRAVSKYRLDALKLEATAEAARSLRRLQAGGLTLPDRTRLIDIDGSGKNRRLVYGSTRDHYTAFPIVSRVVTEEVYFTTLLDAPLPRSPDLTLRLLLDTWEALHYVAIVLQSRIPQNTEVLRLERLYDFCPTLTAAELVDILVRYLDCRPQTAETLLTFFTQPLEATEEFWYRPLLRVAPQRFIPVLGALRAPSLLRSLENWTEAGGLTLARRGPLFETYARAEIADAIQRSKIIRDAGVSPVRVRFGMAADKASTDKASKEEVDLIFWIGGTVVLVETKCVLFPASPYQDHTCYTTLRKATTQISRKVDKARANPHLLLEQLGLSNRIPSGSLSILPLVLVSSPIGAGVPLNNVPVLDLRLLCRYFDPGYSEHWVLVGDDGQKTVGETKPFYRSPQEAEAHLAAYLAGPQPTQQYKEHVVVEWRPLPRLREEEKQCIVGYPIVKLPLPTSSFTASRS